MAGFPQVNQSAAEKVPPELIRAVVERVSASAALEKSPRLRELFRYLCECAVKDSQPSITEHQIGVAVFGRAPHYDSGTDTIVRVQASQLRRKLQNYFFTEGQAEPVVVEIPRGSYVPVFRFREEGAARPSAPAQRSRAALWVLVAACVAGGGGLWVFHTHPAPPSTTPALDRFWEPFQNGRPAQVVVSDANLIMLSDLLGHSVSIHEYRHPGYPANLIETYIQDPKVRQFADRVTETHTTGMQDAEVVRQITLLGSRYQVPYTLISARDFRMPQPNNLILLGHKKGNPWVELFEEGMNFRYAFDHATHSAWIVNRAPLNGELPAYRVEFGRQGYCVVACLPKQLDDGVALLIFGSDMSSLGAGGRFVSDERSLSGLYQRLGQRRAGRPQYFEVLLRTQLLANLAPGFEIIAHRTVAW